MDLSFDANNGEEHQAFESGREGWIGAEQEENKGSMEGPAAREGTVWIIILVTQF